MKYLNLIFLLAFATVINSCTLPEDELNEPTLFGKWSLIEVSGTIAGTTNEFEYGTIVWDFASNHIVVSNANTNQDLFSKFESGAYSFVMGFKPIGQYTFSQTISFSSDDINCLQYDANILFINQNAADGITLKFIR